MPTAYSYIRFSTPEQKEGDSLSRQLNLSRDYAARKGLTLNESLTFKDEGISAFRGKHAKEGALGDFLKAIEKELVKPGSFLLVEDLDRLSREPPSEAYVQFGAILSQGVTIVTLKDERVYTHDAINNDFPSFFMPLAEMYRAHSESKLKGQRLKSSWESKRKRAVEDKTPLTAQCPAWIEKKPSGYRRINWKAKRVKKIFQWASQGMGHALIARRFNEEGVKPIGRAASWHGSYVAKILTNRAVLGEFQPHRTEIGSDGVRRRFPEGEPVAGYFPAVISAAVWQKVQDLRATKRIPTGPRGDRVITNLFTKLVYCGHCGASMHYVDKGKRSKPALVCSKARRGLGCRYQSWTYKEFEDTVLGSIYQTIEWASLGTGLRDSAETVADELEEELATVRQTLEFTEKALQRLIDKLEAVDDAGSVVKRIRDRTAEKRDLESKKMKLEDALSAEKEKARASKIASEYLARAYAEWAVERGQTKEGRERLAAALRDTLQEARLFGAASKVSEDRTVTLSFKPGFLNDAQPQSITLPFDLLVGLGRAVTRRHIARLMIPSGGSSKTKQGRPRTRRKEHAA